MGWRTSRETSSIDDGDDQKLRCGFVRSAAVRTPLWSEDNRGPIRATSVHEIVSHAIRLESGRGREYTMRVAGRPDQPDSSTSPKLRALKKRRRILVVDDDRDLRELLAAVLTSAGYEALTAENGAAALSVLRTVLPELIILDLMMPVMNGWQFREAQTALPDYARIPVVCLSGHHQARHQASTLGIKACVVKPFEIDDLLQVVNRFFPD
jgi:two-component system chemotaxis response regulator CheY